MHVHSKCMYIHLWRQHYLIKRTVWRFQSSFIRWMFIKLLIRARLSMFWDSINLLTKVWRPSFNKRKMWWRKLKFWRRLYFLMWNRVRLYLLKWRLQPNLWRWIHCFEFRRMRWRKLIGLRSVWFKMQVSSRDDLRKSIWRYLKCAIHHYHLINHCNYSFCCYFKSSLYQHESINPSFICHNSILMSIRFDWQHPKPLCSEGFARRIQSFWLHLFPYKCILKVDYWFKLVNKKHYWNIWCKWV